MYYDVDKTYTVKELEGLSSDDLTELFMSAKDKSWGLCKSKLIKKVSADIAIMRTILVGYNSNHNKHPDKESR